MTYTLRPTVHKKDVTFYLWHLR